MYVPLSHSCRKSTTPQIPSSSNIQHRPLQETRRHSRTMRILLFVVTFAVASEASGRVKRIVGGRTADRSPLSSPALPPTNLPPTHLPKPTPETTSAPLAVLFDSSGAVGARVHGITCPSFDIQQSDQEIELRVLRCIVEES
ncbi:hypothetical protein J437_LFUL009034 [Ladona fulva]|uniref:Uncharacterized protein n=1 Tax=Ladona fulva TaxID=123851 RepID=A0A8K0K9A5_LADFU|nr:hypothetical protein J437_LFUL009034 [Ladona fulva]